MCRCSSLTVGGSFGALSVASTLAEAQGALGGPATGRLVCSSAVTPTSDPTAPSPEACGSATPARQDSPRGVDEALPPPQ